jgi:hypothetical protein
MPRPISELFKEIASRASEIDEPVLALLCRMAALEAARMNLSLSWNWNAADNAPPLTVVSNRPPRRAPTTLGEAIAKPYQVWTRSGTGMYSVIVPNAKAALATVVQLSGGDHEDVSIKDMDGNEIELEVLKVMVEMEANPTFRLVPR